MGKRLPPGEAERRAKERARATWSGEKYRKIEAGSPEQWAAIAAAFVSGDAQFLHEARSFKADPVAASVRRKNPNPYLAQLDLDEMPTRLADLTRGYRAAVMMAFRKADCVDTSPAYVAEFTAITKAFDRIKLQRGW